VQNMEIPRIKAKIALKYIARQAQDGKYGHDKA